MLKSKLTGAVVVHGLLFIAVANGPETKPALPLVKQGTIRFMEDSTSPAISATSNNSVPMPTAPEIKLNPKGVKYVQNYMKVMGEELDLVKGRSEKLFIMMDTILAKYNLPQELKYLAVIESNCKSSATSRVGAAGTWQLMPGTARELGLKVKGKVDERRNNYKATIAAAKYLRDLNRIFGDWLLVIAAYNSGPGPVLKAIKRTGSRNFWVLQNHLPAESRNHVKRYIGTHYYYDGAGGITTLTKKETEAYLKAMDSYKEKLAEFESATSLVIE